LLGHIGVARWPSAAALLLVGVLYLLVSENLTLGPSWVLPAAIVALLVPFAVRGHHLFRQRLGLVLIAAVTAALVATTTLLVIALPTADLGADVLLKSAALIWFTNILVFAVWYSEIDGGGPVGRDPNSHASRDFLFPQDVIGGELAEGWSPGFIDYLFIAFTASTAFGPSDTNVLSARGKVLMMVQAVISLAVIAVIAARAINLIH
jgi:uncharacterized membrane protein